MSPIRVTRSKAPPQSIACSVARYSKLAAQIARARVMDEEGKVLPRLGSTPRIPVTPLPARPYELPDPDSGRAQNLEGPDASFGESPGRPPWRSGAIEMVPASWLGRKVEDLHDRLERRSLAGRSARQVDCERLERAGRDRERAERRDGRADREAASCVAGVRRPFGDGLSRNAREPQEYGEEGQGPAATHHSTKSREARSYSCTAWSTTWPVAALSSPGGDGHVGRPFEQDPGPALGARARGHGSRRLSLCGPRTTAPPPARPQRPTSSASRSG